MDVCKCGLLMSANNTLANDGTVFVELSYIINEVLLRVARSVSFCKLAAASHNNTPCI